MITLKKFATMLDKLGILFDTYYYPSEDLIIIRWKQEYSGRFSLMFEKRLFNYKADYDNIKKE